MKRLAPPLAVALALTALVLPASALATHAEPLRGQWHLDESNTSCTGGGLQLLGGPVCTPDSSGHGLSAVHSGTLDSQTSGGRFGGHYSFAGGFAGVSSTLLEPAQLTLLAWVRASPSPGAGRTVIAQGDPGACGPASFAMYTGADAGLHFYVRSADAAYEAPGVPAGIWDGEWHMVAGTFDGATARFYLDGGQVGSGTLVPGPIQYGLSNTNDFSMGNIADAGSCPADTYHDGDLDETRVYSRALTPTEIAALAAWPGPDPPPPLVPETPPPGGGGGGGGGGGLGELQIGPFLTGKSFKLPGAAWLKAPLLGEGIVPKKFEWDWNNDGKYDASCGGDTPAASHPYFGGGGASSAAVKTIRLRVTDTLGRIGTVTQKVTVKPIKIKSIGKAKTVSTCEKAALENQPSRADCVKTFSFSIIEVNARGDADQCFKIDAPIGQLLNLRRGGKTVKVFKKLRKRSSATASQDCGQWRARLHSGHQGAGCDQRHPGSPSRRASRATTTAVAERSARVFLRWSWCFPPASRSGRPRICTSTSSRSAGASRSSR